MSALDEKSDVRSWMRFYIGDYMRDTGHLRAAHHGAYIMLIMHYWQKGGLPSDDAQLATIARMTDKEWRAAKAVLAGFFKPGWKHSRVEREIAAAEGRYKQRVEIAKKAAAARHGRGQVRAFPGSSKKGGSDA